MMIITQEEALAILDGHPDHESAMPWMRAWAESGDQAKMRHVLGRLKFPVDPASTASPVDVRGDTADFGVPPRTNRFRLHHEASRAVRGCPHWVKGTSDEAAKLAVATGKGGCPCGINFCRIGASPDRAHPNHPSLNDCICCIGYDVRNGVGPDVVRYPTDPDRPPSGGG